MHLQPRGASGITPQFFSMKGTTLLLSIPHDGHSLERHTRGIWRSQTADQEKTLVEGASAAVELVETIRVTLPLTHSLNAAADGAKDDDAATALADTMSADQKAKVGKTPLCHKC